MKLKVKINGFKEPIAALKKNEVKVGGATANHQNKKFINQLKKNIKTIKRKK
ncbi:MAG: hypothetical protein K9H26_10830 [Prolixibacteraceae bacterium]|nr:hypothetical protein [Prolixibacteraceae bacterium]